MKKLLLTEVILACFFLLLILGIVGEVTIWREDALETGSELYQEEARKENTIWIFPGKMSDSFSPLQYQEIGEKNVIAMCFSNLLIRDHEGRRKNHEVSASWEDRQFAHISSQYDTNTNICSVKVELNPKAKAVNKEAVTAEDILFNYYLRADASSGIIKPFGNVEIVGQKEYFYGTTDISAREKEIETILKKPSAAVRERWSEEIIRPELTKELQWVKSLYYDTEYETICNKYKEPKDLFAYYFAYQTKYSSIGKSENQVFSEIVKQYKGDYRKLAKITKKNYTENARQIVLSIILQQKDKDLIKKISGIKKLDTHTVEILVKGNEECVDKVCNLWLLPLSQYGMKKSFNGTDSFGYVKGKAAEIVQEAMTKYSGTGPYHLKERRDEKMIFDRNPYYFGGKANIKEIQIWQKDYKEYEEIIRELLEQKIDLVFVKDDDELEALLQNRAMRVTTRIQKETFVTSQQENCFLYRTSYINTPSIPKDISEFCSLFEQIHLLQTNSPEQE